MNHIFTLPGEWSPPWMLLRLLEVVECPWQMHDGVFTNLDTGETVGIAFGEHVEGMRAAFEGGGDLTRPELPADLLDAIEQHQGVVQIQAPMREEDPLGALETALRAANGVIDGGALGLHISSSGLVHEADAFQALMRGLDSASSRGRSLYGMVVRYQLGALSTTIGMEALGLPDVLLSSPEDPDRAVGKMERAAFRLLEGEVLPIVSDQRTGPTNPHGLVVL